MAQPEFPTAGPDGISGSWVEVDLDVVAANFRAAVALAGHGGYAVVKADAYGHGAVDVARRLEKEFPAGDATGLHGFCVARPEEAETLSRAGVRWPILTLGAFPSALSAAGRQALAQSAHRHGWQPVVSSPADLRFWLDCRREGDPPIHVEVDSGMQRTGLAIADLGQVVRARQAGLEIVSVFSHFIDSEAPGGERSGRQERDFLDALWAHPELRDLRVHVDNSAGLRRRRRMFSAEPSARQAAPGFTQRSFRLGGGLYGLDLAAEEGAGRAYRPAMRVRSRLVQVRRAEAGSTVGYSGTYRLQEPRWIGTLAIGYADGLPRSLCHQTVIFDGAGAARPIVGRISMDLTTVDLGPVEGDAPPIAPGTPATVLGDARPGLEPADLARHADSLSYEVTCRLGARLPRVFIGDAP